LDIALRRANAGVMESVLATQAGTIKGANALIHTRFSLNFGLARREKSAW
jgi:hypothetical protein